ncbi:MAG: SDR family oxidoreductase [Acidobacteriota bacterium]|nr:SDR family oxidoreductase [Acidobacteriota bacterium]
MTTTSEYYSHKVAVVTGGASGVGLALAESMLGFGAARIVLADLNEQNLDAHAARLLAAHPGKVLGVRTDVTDEAAVKKMIGRAAEFGDGRIDLLFNNAGAGFSGAFEQTSNEDWQNAFALNFYGALYGIRAVLPIMRAQGSGHIVNVISGIAFAPMPLQSMYSATKAALNGLSLSLRAELWDDDIRVSSATPGTTATAIWGDVPPPANAQTAEAAADKILAGVAVNQRLILGDAGDESGARNCFLPEAADGNDQYFVNVARQRKQGAWVV